MRRTMIVTALALGVVLTAAVAAFAVGQTVTANISKPAAGQIVCGGVNNVDGTNNMDTVGVSYVCQYKDSAGNWHDVRTAPASRCYDVNICSGSWTMTCSNDGLPAGTWTFRGEADGWHVHYNGAEHVFTGSDKTSITKSYSCSG